MLWTRFAGRGEGSRNATQYDSLFIITLKNVLIATKGVYRTTEKKREKGCLNSTAQSVAPSFFCAKICAVRGNNFRFDC
jgi:hypothetical protein